MILLGRAKFYDAAVFTATTKHGGLDNCRRLVVGEVESYKAVKHFVRETKFITPLHTKLYLLYNSDGVLFQGIVGSHNLVYSTSLNLSVRITAPAELEALKTVFEEIWNTSKYDARTTT